MQEKGKLSIDGAIVVDTGQHKGGSASDKFLVREPVTESFIRARPTIEGALLLPREGKVAPRSGAGWGSPPVWSSRVARPIRFEPG